MTVVNPKSISGINSITMASGSDNLLTIHTTNTTERVRVNSDGDVIVGSGITVSPDGDIFATGVTTSTTFSGNFSGGTVSGTTGTFSGAISGTTGAFSQNIAIRLSSATNNLHVHQDDSDKSILQFSNTTTGTATGDGFQIGISGDEEAVLDMKESKPIIFSTAGSESARIDSNGKFLIGTTETSSNQSGALNVFGNDGTTSFVSIRRGSNNASGPRLALCKSRNTTDGAASGLLSDDDILGTIHFYGNDSQGFEEGAAIAASIDGTPGSNDLPTRLTFSTTPDGSDTKVERLRIDSSGRVMIGSGTYIGGAALAVLGTGNTPNAYGSLAIGKVGANPTSGTTLANIRLNGGAVGTRRGAEINAIADANWTDGSSHPTYLTFGTVTSGATSATERMRIHAGGNVDIKTGSLVISTAGQGINFQATSSITGMESESLDDYEEGSYTCVLTGSGGGSHNITGCSYVKVGKQVTCQITLANPGSNSVSGYWSFTLPFQAVQTSGFAYFGGYVTYTRHLPGYTEGNGNFSHIALHTYHGQSSAVLYKLRNGSGEANTLQGSLNTQAILAFTMVYNAVT